MFIRYTAALALAESTFCLPMYIEKVLRPSNLTCEPFCYCHSTNAPATVLPPLKLCDSSVSLSLVYLTTVLSVYSRRSFFFSPCALKDSFSSHSHQMVNTESLTPAWMLREPEPCHGALQISFLFNYCYYC